MARKPIQFNWRRHWRTKVEPHLGHPLVRAALGLGMRLLDPAWKTGDPPYALGSTVPGRRVVKGKLSWYRPVGRCHWIAFFSCAVGTFVYPHLRWDIVTGDLHTVAVGYDPAGDIAVVMDILLFDQITAEESLRRARMKVDGVAPSNMDECFKLFVGCLSSVQDAYFNPIQQRNRAPCHSVPARRPDPGQAPVSSHSVYV